MWGVNDNGVNIKYVEEYNFAKCYCDDGGLVTDDEHGLQLGDYTNAWQKWTCRSNASLPRQ